MSAAVIEASAVRKIFSLDRGASVYHIEIEDRIETQVGGETVLHLHRLWQRYASAGELGQSASAWR